MISKLNKLERDLIFFDIESTGTDIKLADIIEICAIRHTVSGERIVYKKRFNTDIIMSEEVVNVHGISNEDLKEEKYFSECAEEIYEFFKGCDLGGYNCRNYDIPLLYEKLANSSFYLNIFKVNVIDSYEIYNAYEPRDLNSLYERLIGESIENLHSSESDIIATEKVFSKQLELYNLPKDVSSISKEVKEKSRKNYIDFSRWFYRKEGDVYYNKGKNRDMKVDCDLSYLSWLVNESTMEKNSKFVAKLLLDKYSEKIV